MQLPNKGNVVLYLDKDLVEKSKELGFNLSKTFENHLKQLVNPFELSMLIPDFTNLEIFSLLLMSGLIMI